MNVHGRAVEVWIDNNWKEIEFCKLQRGDLFRMFEDKEKKIQVKDNSNCTNFLADSNPYLKDNLYMINYIPTYIKG